MLGQKRLLLGIELTLFAILIALALSAGFGVIVGLFGLVVAVAGTLTPMPPLERSSPSSPRGDLQLGR